MAIRINNAQDFAGRTYLTTEALTGFITDFALTGNTLALTINANGSTQEFTTDLGSLVTTAEGVQFVSVTSNVISDSALTTFLGTTGAAASASKIVTTNASGNLEYVNVIGDAVRASGATSANVLPTETAIRTAIDAVANQAINVTGGTGINVTSGTGTEKIISTDIKVVKLGAADTGYAATYQLMVKSTDDQAEGYDNGYVPAGEKIQILKDQFLKKTEFIASATADDVTAAGANPGFVAGEPVLKFTMELTGTTSDTDSYLYIPVKSLVDVYTAGNGIDITSNTVSVNIETATDALQIYTASGTQTDLIAATASGLVVANVQAAIDLAVENEHAKMSAAVIAVEGNVETLQGATATAVTALNTRIETVATNAASAANALEGEIVALDGKVSAAITSVDANLSAAVANVATSVNARTANAVQMLETSVNPAALNNGVTGDYGCSLNANNIIAVYDGNGIEIYPEITRIAAAGTGSGSYDYSLKASYGSTTPDSAWTVLYTMPLAAYPGVTAGTVTFGAATSTTKTVDNGTAATAPAAVSASVGALDYKG